MRQLCWSKYILETFLDESGINDRVELGDEKARMMQFIMRTRVSGWPIVKQAEQLHVSVDTVNKYIKELKKLYDTIQRYNSDLPTRRQSKREQEMDN